MIPSYLQQPTNPTAFGYQQQQQQQFGFQQQHGFCPNIIPINWQDNNGWSGGSLHGQRMPLPPPPFLYPIDHSKWTEAPPSRNNGRRQVQRSYGYSSRHHSVNPQRSILKKADEWKTPTQRRLVHFMPKYWRETSSENDDNEKRHSSENRKFQQTTANQRNKQSAFGSTQRPAPSKKTPEKAQRDTLRRRERRQRARDNYPDDKEAFDCLLDNRFDLLSESDGDETDSDSSEAENIKSAMRNHPQEKQNTSKGGKRRNNRSDDTYKNGTTDLPRRTTTEVPNNNGHVVTNKAKTRGKNQLEMATLSTNEESNEVPSNKDKRKVKNYLQSFKVLAYLRERMNNDRRIKLDLKDVFNEVCTFAKDTVEAYDNWVKNNYEVQVWQYFYTLGRDKGHWAKEIVNITHTRDTQQNAALCESKISQFTSACFDANDIIARIVREFSDNSAIIAGIKRAQDLMLDYVKSVTKGLEKMSMNRIRLASVEKDEWNALMSFENVASEQQKFYAKAFCKPALKNFHKKKKNHTLVAEHISQDIVPKIIPQYDFNLPIDETSLSSEQIQENKENILKLSKEFRLKTTELYLKIAREEFSYQEERLHKLLDDFPPDRNDESSTQVVVDSNNIEHFDDDDNIDDEGVQAQKPFIPLTQRPRLIQHQSQRRKENNLIGDKPFELFRRYIELAHRRAELETEKEIHFLSERGVKETPFEIKEARDLNPILRKDFVLQVQ